MITIRKLAKLPVATRRRKIVRLLESFERDRQWPDSTYREGLAGVLEADVELPPAVRDAAAGLRGDSQADMPRVANDLRHRLMQYLGLAPGEWDLLPPAGSAATQARPVSPLAHVELYLESIRSPFNLGSIIRTAAAFGIERIGISDDCPSVDHPRVQRSAMGAVDLVQICRRPLEALAETSDASCFALEFGGRPCFELVYPRRGVLMLGSEELGLSPNALALARETISIATSGRKASLNVGVACGIALAAWQDSLAKGQPQPGWP